MQGRGEKPKKNFSGRGLKKKTSLSQSFLESERPILLGAVIRQRDPDRPTHLPAVDAEYVHENMPFSGRVFFQRVTSKRLRRNSEASALLLAERMRSPRKLRCSTAATSGVNPEEAGKQGRYVPGRRGKTQGYRQTV